MAAQGLDCIKAPPEAGRRRPLKNLETARKRLSAGLNPPRTGGMVRPPARTLNAAGPWGETSVAETSDPLLREIEEELREERFAKLWRRYGKAAAVAVALLIIAVAAVQWYKSHTFKARQAEGARYDAAAELLRGGNGEEAARTAFEALAADAGDGYALLARLRAAQLKAAEGDTVGARAAFLAVAGDGAYETLYRELGAYRAAMLGMALKISPESLRAELAPLTDDNSPWRLPARELLALVDLDAGEQAKARTAFQAIADDSQTPPGMRARAETVLSTLPPQGGA